MSRWKRYRPRRKSKAQKPEGVVFIQRTDLTNDAGKLTGAYHIENPDTPGFGYCFNSDKRKIELLNKRGYHRGAFHRVYDNDSIHYSDICIACRQSHEKRGTNQMAIQVGEHVIPSQDCVQVNNRDYVSTYYAQRLIDEAVAKAKQEAEEKRGEVRTIQEVVLKESLVEGTRRYFRRTFLAIKSNDEIKYRAGQKIRIIIEQER